MKKNSFKRFLAITLAAATALTFAPVSTLGLTGVVAEATEAKAKIGLNKDSFDAGTDTTITVTELSVTDDIAAHDVYNLYIAKSPDTKVADAEATGITATVTDKASSDDSAKVKAEVDGTAKAKFTCGTDGNKINKNLKEATSALSFAIDNSVNAGDYYVVLSKGALGSDTVLASEALPGYAKKTITVIKGHSTVKGLDSPAALGTTETFTVTPDSGYTLKSVTYSAGNENKVLTATDGKYSFVMPDAAVTIQVILTKNTTPGPTTHTNGFTTGGVLTTVPAYDGATFDLIEDAAISYDGVNYSKDDLTWYLSSSTKTVGANANGANEPENIKPVSTDGKLSAGKGVLKLTTTNTTNMVSKFDTVYAIATYPINGVPTVVSSTKVTLSDLLSDAVFNTAPISAKAVKSGDTVNVSVTASQKPPADPNKTVLDNVQITNPDNYNKYVEDSNHITLGDTEVYGTKANFTLAPVKASTSDKRNVLKGSTLTQNKNLSNGTYHETYYIPYVIDSGATIYLMKVNVTASVSTGPKFRVVDNGNILATTFADDKLATDPTVYLDLKTNKTFDIAAHTTSDIAGTTYTYTSDSSNVTVDAKGVITAKSVGPANITIEPKAGDVTGATKTLRVIVNASPFASFTVTGKDSDTADVLNASTYNNNVKKLSDEKALAAAQVKYIQIEDNGTETTDIKEAVKTTTIATGASISYVFAATDSNTQDDMVIDAQTGEITVPYGVTELKSIQGKAYAVKVVSTGTSAYEATTGYYYFVVDYPDATPSGLQDAYTVGTDKGADQEIAINFSKEVKGAPTIGFEALRNSDDALKGDTALYADESIGSFYTTDYANLSDYAEHTSNVAILDASAAGKVAYILVDFQTTGAAGTGHTYRIVKLTSAEGKINTIKTIVNTDTNETLFDVDKDTTRAPQLSINEVTHLTVTLAYPVNTNKTQFKIYFTKDDGTVINQYTYVTAVKDDKVSVTLYPNEKGTEVIYFTPSGNISDTDRTITANHAASVSVTYSGEFVKPAQVTGVKVSNKKGAKVTVKFNKVDTNPTMRYYVQKKIGKKVSGKSIGSTKTTLSVKKGATVKVRVKAYFYDASGKKHVGKYSAWKTLKTDKK